MRERERERERDLRETDLQIERKRYLRESGCGNVVSVLAFYS